MQPIQKKGLKIGWEAGIRTPMTWSRERCTRSLPLPFVRFHAVLFVTASVCSFLFSCAPVQRVSLCLRGSLDSRAMSARRRAVPPQAASSWSPQWCKRCLASQPNRGWSDCQPLRNRSSADTRAAEATSEVPIQSCLPGTAANEVRPAARTSGRLPAYRFGTLCRAACHK